MAPTTTSTANLEAENPVQPRRSSRVTSKPTSFGNTKPTSPKRPDAKKNGAAKSKAAGSKKSDKALTKADPAEPSDDTSPSAPGEPEKRSNSDDAANEDEEPPAAKKAKTDAEVPDDKETSEESGSKKKLAVGDKLIEGIELSTEDEKKIDILEAVKEKGAIIFIYPKANTPGCTNQACGFRDLYQEIVDAGYQVFGLSRDSPKSQKNWKDKQTLPYTLLCDPEQQLIKLLGASKSATTVQRSHYIIAQGGEILNITSPASPKNGPQEALDFIKSL